MKYFKVVGGNKELIKLIENFLEKEDFEEQMKEIIFESARLDIPYEETQAFKKMAKKYRKKTK